MPGPLSGVRVLDFSTVLMGPYACGLLAEHGADVIKVEPLSGDLGREVGPARHSDMGSLFMGFNRGKRSIAIDLKSQEGMALLLKLVARADVLVTNVRPASLARLGLTDAVVRTHNPRIIFCRLFGYGEDGPYAGRSAYDDLIQAAVAIPALVAEATGGEPRFAPINIADRTVGLSVAGTIAMALYHRERTGEGQQIDVPMFETMAGFVLSDHLYGRTFEPALGKAGYVRLLADDRRPYRTRDGHICAVVYSDQNWRAFLGFVGKSDLLEDPRFASMRARTANVEDVLRFLSDELQTRTTAEWLEIFDRLDIPCAAVNTLDSLIDDEHLRAVGFFKQVDHPTEGSIRVAQVAAKWSASPPGADRECPRLGEHSAEILRELGCTPEEIERLTREKIVYALAAEQGSADRAA